MWIEFLVTAFVVVISPGTGVVYTIGVGLSRGALASVVAAAGCTLGILPHMTAAILGLSALLLASETAFQIFKLAGVGYLLFMAWSILRQAGALEMREDSGQTDLWRVALRGGLINILHPKLSVFFLAFLPQFIPEGATAPLLHMAILSLIFMGMTWVVFVAYGCFAARLRRHVISSPSALQVLRRLFAAAFGVLAMRLLLATA
mgnify:CR=1 FL=1